MGKVRSDVEKDDTCGRKPDAMMQIKQIGYTKSGNALLKINKNINGGTRRGT